MTRYAVLLDANVLYPAPLRDLLLQLAVADLYRARWTDDIHDEWISNLLLNDPRLERAALERTRARMDAHTRDCLITGHHALVESLSLPDPKDRHVLAAAIVGRCDAIVTCNLKDFPGEALAPYRIEALHPDDFLYDNLNLAPDLFCDAVRKVRARLKNPPYSVADYLATLKRQGLGSTASELETLASRL